MVPNNRSLAEEICVVDSVVQLLVASDDILYVGHLLGNFKKYMVIVTLLAPTDAETFTVQVGKGSAADGTGFVALKSPITESQTYTLAAHATNNDGKVIVIGIDDVLWQQETSLDYLVVKLLTSSTTGTDLCVTILGVNHRATPVWAQNALNTTALYQNRADDDANIVMLMR
jgi:hypothetical protein